MAFTPPPTIRRVLILKADRLYSDMLRRVVLDLLPRAEVTLAQTISAASYALHHVKYDLFIAGIDGALDGDVLPLLVEPSHPSGHQPNIFVVGSDLEYRILVALHDVTLQGVFDPSADSPEEFDTALRTVVRGERYWSQSVLERLRRDLSGPTSLCHHLSTTEQLVLAMLGDGSDDSTAADALGLSPATISTFRRKLHRKLRVQHRGELIRVAAQNGFVRFTPSGVVRPGFAMLAAECLARKRKRPAVDRSGEPAFLTVKVA